MGRLSELYPRPEPRDPMEPYPQAPQPALPGAPQMTAAAPGTSVGAAGPTEQDFRLGATGSTGRTGQGRESLKLNNTANPMDKP